MPTISIPGAAVKVKINGKTLSSIQSINWNIDYGTKQIYGIDSEFPQEIAMTKFSIKGNVSNVRLRFSEGLQGANAVPIISNMLGAKYNYIQILDRQSNKPLLEVDRAIISNQNYDVPTKGVVTFSFSFLGTIGREELEKNITIVKDLIPANFLPAGLGDLF